MSSDNKKDETKQEPKKQLIEAMEEDDHFEEFQEEHWGKDSMTETNKQQWLDNWDDDMDDDFTKNLREELLKSSPPATKK